MQLFVCAGHEASNFKEKLSLKSVIAEKLFCSFICNLFASLLFRELFDLNKSPEGIQNINTLVTAAFPFSPRT